MLHRKPHSDSPSGRRPHTRRAKLWPVFTLVHIVVLSVTGGHLLNRIEAASQGSLQLPLAWASGLGVHLGPFLRLPLASNEGGVLAPLVWVLAVVWFFAGIFGIASIGLGFGFGVWAITQYVRARSAAGKPTFAILVWLLFAIVVGSFGVIAGPHLLSLFRVWLSFASSGLEWLAQSSVALMLVLAPLVLIALAVSFTPLTRAIREKLPGIGLKPPRVQRPLGPKQRGVTGLIQAFWPLAWAGLFIFLATNMKAGARPYLALLALFLVLFRWLAIPAGHRLLARYGHQPGPSPFVQLALELDRKHDGKSDHEGPAEAGGFTHRPKATSLLLLTAASVLLIASVTSLAGPISSLPHSPKALLVTCAVGLGCWLTWRVVGAQILRYGERPDGLRRQVLAALLVPCVVAGALYVAPLPERDRGEQMIRQTLSKFGLYPRQSHKEWLRGMRRPMEDRPQRRRVVSTAHSRPAPSSERRPSAREEHGPADAPAGCQDGAVRRKASRLARRAPDRLLSLCDTCTEAHHSTCLQAVLEAVAPVPPPRGATPMPPQLAGVVVQLAGKAKWLGQEVAPRTRDTMVRAMGALVQGGAVADALHLHDTALNEDLHEASGRAILDNIDPKALPAAPTERRALAALAEQHLGTEASPDLRITGLLASIEVTSIKRGGMAAWLAANPNTPTMRRARVEVALANPEKLLAKGRLAPVDLAAMHGVFAPGQAAPVRLWLEGLAPGEMARWTKAVQTAYASDAGVYCRALLSATRGRHAHLWLDHSESTGSDLAALRAAATKVLSAPTASDAQRDARLVQAWTDQQSNVRGR